MRRGRLAEAPLLRGRLRPGRSSSSRAGSLGGARTGRPGSEDRARRAEAGPAASGCAGRSPAARVSEKEAGTPRAPARSPRGGPAGGPRLFPARLPSALLGARPRLCWAPARNPGRSPQRLSLPAAVAAAARISLYHARARVSRDVRSRSRETGAGLAVKLRARALTEAEGSVSVPRPGCRGSQNARNQRPARGTTSVPLCAAGQASTGRPSRSLVWNSTAQRWPPGAKLSCSPD